MYRLLLAVIPVAFGCGQLELTQNLQEKMTSYEAVYPVAEHVHQGSSSQTVTLISELKPEISNSNAYMRYAVELLGGTAMPTEVLTPVEMALSTARYATAEIPWSVLMSFRRVSASTEDYSQYHRDQQHHSRPIRGDSLSRTGREIVDGEARLSVCVSSGYSIDQCCSHLLWLEGFRDDESIDPSLTPFERTQRIVSELTQEHSEPNQINPFRHSGIRSWLSYCGPALARAPDSLTEFKLIFGDFRSAPGWTQEFHPISPAKQAGRRIYRSTLSNGTQVSIAESIADDCSVIETEAIVKPIGQQAMFWVFEAQQARVNHAYFPSRSHGIDTVKYAPNTCMGCHYTFDTRHFDVVAPSFSALKLTLFNDESGPVWRDHSHCAEPGESVVLHAVN